jgi:hypothetical protein
VSAHAEKIRGESLPKKAPAGQASKAREGQDESRYEKGDAEKTGAEKGPGGRA